MLRGAVLSQVFAVDTHYPAAVSNGSPLFKLPVDAVQRGRDHGLPTYNDARLVSGPQFCSGAGVLVPGVAQRALGFVVVERRRV